MLCGKIKITFDFKQNPQFEHCYKVWKGGECLEFIRVGKNTTPRTIKLKYDFSHIRMFALTFIHL